ncbi:unnamed protein product [Rotaria socialis]|uniref:Uncharacterized protein n=1 Tax=Rotaria socialis TaxID=392032 RepID=A0A817W376_9BILA|nr:unnamed protein product [Rotaria socialis]CAF4536323.1 unnamed protein product [Rotaria socialis]
MRLTNMHLMIIAICVIINFIIPTAQLSIGFGFIVGDGQNPNAQCASAPDLPLLMAFGGIFTLFFLGIAYGFIIIISAPSKPGSDVAGKMPKVLVGLYSCFFGAIAFIIFILTQIRVYGAYSSGFQTGIANRNDFCKAILMHGSLAIIILTYLNMFVFTGVLLFFSIRRAT